MTKRKTKTTKRKPKIKDAGKLTGQSILWEGDAYIVTQAYTVKDGIHERLELTAVRFLPINF